ncbi:MAG: prenyltransferase [Rhodospirillales bacterium]|nr:prenyltransferase [Rhodospirillales bacterium]
MSALIGIIRPPFLLLVPACVAVGVAVAHEKAGAFDGSLLAIILIGALCAHAAVNALNEVCDFKNGLDLNTDKTPFSGGSGTLPAHPDLLPAAQKLAAGLLAVTILTGLVLLYKTGWPLLWAGLPGVLIVAAYGPWLVFRPILTLIAPGAGFGLAMIMGTEYVLSGSYSWSGLAAALPVFFLTNNLLLINQLPDIAADRAAGRKNIPILWGEKKAVLLAALFYAGAYGAMVFAVSMGVLPLFVFSGLLTMPLAVIVIIRLWQSGPVIPAMALNVAVTLLTPVLMAAGLFL